jgi:uncharacterized protein DUF1931
MTTTTIPRLVRFFRVAASLDLDKQDLKRYDDFVQHKVEDLLVRARATAKANDGRPRVQKSGAAFRRSKAVPEGARLESGIKPICAPASELC